MNGIKNCQKQAALPAENHVQANNFLLAHRAKEMDGRAMQVFVQKNHIYIKHV